MKQQFFVGDVVKLNQLGVDEGNESVRESEHDWWSRKYLSMLKHNDTAKVSKLPTPADDGVWLENNSFFLSREHLDVVARAWQKNTGEQPVDDGVEVFAKFADGTIDRAKACMFDWYAGDIGSIVEWHIADSVSSNEEQPEAIPPSHVALGDESVSTDVSTGQEWTDKHYDNNYTLIQKDIERGFVKIDPYRVSKQWRLGSKDESGVLFHILKTVARYGEKNSREREVKALYAQIKCLAEIEGVNLGA